MQEPRTNEKKDQRERKQKTQRGYNTEEAQKQNKKKPNTERDRDNSRKNEKEQEKTEEEKAVGQPSFAVFIPKHLQVREFYIFLPFASFFFFLYI